MKNAQKLNDMTLVQEIQAKIDQNGSYLAYNNAAGWEAISRDGIRMITYFEGAYTFTQKGDVIRFYTERGFARRVEQLANRGY
jgi:hypothetical protein